MGEDGKGGGEGGEDGKGERMGGEEGEDGRGGRGGGRGWEGRERKRERMGGEEGGGEDRGDNVVLYVTSVHTAYSKSQVTGPRWRICTSPTPSIATAVI